MPQVRELGCRSIRLFLFWGQIEPKPGHFAWQCVDAFLDQLQPADEAWIMLGTSSLWATRRATELLPCSPARDLNEYANFVQALVRHCQGRVCVTGKWIMNRMNRFSGLARLRNMLSN